MTVLVRGLLDDSSRLEQRRARIGAWLLAVAGILVLLRLEAGAAALATVLGVYARSPAFCSWPPPGACARTPSP
jgi:hypothetical protein